MRRAQAEIEAYNSSLQKEMEHEQERHARNIEALNQRKEQMVQDKKAKLKVRSLRGKWRKKLNGVNCAN